MDENEVLLFADQGDPTVIEDGYQNADVLNPLQDDSDLFQDQGESNPTVIEDGYQQRDNAFVYQDDSELFQDNGETNNAIITGAYQQQDYVPPVALLAQDPDYDWSEFVPPDFIASSYINVDAPSLGVVEETWQDEDVEHESYWWVEENGYATSPVVIDRQEGDDDSTLAMDDVGEDITEEIVRDDLTPFDVIPPTTVTMPYLIGMLFGEAFTIVQGLGLVMITPPQSANVIYPFAPEPKGTVIQQYPIAGTQVALGSSVYVVVSSGLIVYPQGDAVEANVPNIVIGNDTPP